MDLWILIALTIILCVCYKIYKAKNYWQERGVPYQKSWPLLGEMYYMVFRILPMPLNIQRIYNNVGNQRYSGYYQFLQPTLMIKDPDLIKQIGVRDFDNFVDHRKIVSAEHDPLFGRNLLTLNGNDWRTMRSTLSPAFTSSKIKGMFNFIIECADQLVEHFLNNKDEASSLEMKDIFTRYTTDVIATCAFGLECNSVKDKQNEFYSTGKDATDFTGYTILKFFGFAISPLLMKILKIKIVSDRHADFFRKIVRDTIEHRVKNGVVRQDMIHLLMKARKGQLKHDETTTKTQEGFAATVEESHIEEKEEKYKKTEWSDDDITAQAFVFFLGGFDTASTTLSYGTYELATNPDIQKKLQDEIDNTNRMCNGKITFEAISKMTYLDMVVSETLRKWPPFALIDRLCTKDYVINPVKEGEKAVHVEKGVVCIFPIFALHRDPENYPNPDLFDPERFSEENKRKIKPFTYIPFGIGPRGCIGSRFALLEVKAVLFKLLLKFDVVLTEKTPIPLKLSKVHVNMSPEGGFWLGLKPREKN